VISLCKTKPVKECFDKLKSLDKHIKIVVFVDEEGNDISNIYMLIWRVVNNIDVMIRLTISFTCK